MRVVPAFWPGILVTSSIPHLIKLQSFDKTTILVTSLLLFSFLNNFEKISCWVRSNPFGLLACHQGSQLVTHFFGCVVQFGVDFINNFLGVQKILHRKCEVTVMLLVSGYCKLDHSIKVIIIIFYLKSFILYIKRYKSK